MRDFDDVILDLSDKWDTLSRNQQRYIATTAAGSRQQSRFIALLSNSERLHELIEIAEDSAGRSQQQFDKYADTIEYKLKKIQNTWEKFRVKLLPQELYKKALDYINLFLERITNINWIDFTALAATFLTAGKVAGQGLLQGLKGSSVGLLNLFSSWGTAISNLFSNAGAFFSGKNWIKKSNETMINNSLAYVKTYGPSYLNENQSKQFGLQAGVHSEEELVKGLEKQQEAQKMKAAQHGQVIGYTLAASITGAISSFMVRNQPQKVFWDTFVSGGAIAITQAINQGFEAAKNGGVLKGLGTGAAFGLKGLAVTGIIAGITAAIKYGVNAYKEYKEQLKLTEDAYYRYGKQLETLQKQQEKLNEKLSKSSTAFNEAKDGYKDLFDNANKLQDLNKKLILTEEEKQEKIEISNQLAENYPELISGYDNENDAIIELNNAYKELIELKEQEYNLTKKNLDLDKLSLKANEYAQVLTQIKQEGERKNTIDQIVLKGSSSIESEKVSGLYWNAGKNINISSKATVNLLKDQYSTETELIKQALYQQKIIISGEGEEFLDNLRNWLDENNGNLNKFWEALSKYEPPKTNTAQREKLLGKELEDLINNTLSDSIKLVTQGTRFKEASASAFQAAIWRIQKANPDLSLENLKAQYEKVDDFSEYVHNTVDWAKVSEVLQKFLNDDIKAWDIVSELITEDMSLRQQYDIIRKKVSPEDRNNWVKNNYESLKEEYENAKYIADLTNSILVGNLDKVNWTFTGPTTSLGEVFLEMGKTAQKRFIDALNQTNEISPALRGNFVELMQQLLDSIGTDKFKELMTSVDWEEYSIFDRQKILDILGKDGEKFLGIVEDIFAKIDDIAENSLNKLEEKYDSTLKIIQAIGKATSSQAESSHVDASALRTLRKEGVPLEKMFTNGIFDIAKAESYAKQIAQEEIYNTAQDLMAEDNKKRLSYETSLKELEVQKDITKEKYLQIRVSSGTNANTASQEWEELEKKGKSAFEYLTEVRDNFLESRDESLNDYLKVLYDSEMQAYLSIIDDRIEKEQKAVEKAEDNAEKIKKANKAVADAYDDILEKQKALLKAQEALNETLYGTDFHKGTLDNLYNYQKALETLNDTIEQTKEDLENLNGQNPKELLNTLFAATRSKNIYLAAQNERYNAATKETESMLNNELQSYLRSKGYNAQVSDFYKYNSQLGYYEVDQAAITAARMNDNLKDFVANQIDTMNTYLKAIKDNNREQKKLQKEMEDYQKQTRDKYIEVQEEVVKKLKESYQKEIDDKKEMYNALTEADNKYLDALEDAINKQRKLRDKQDKWDELATKEKKLSLLQRDTSGAAAKETQKLRQDIQKDRQSLLDDTVDEVVDNLKELYETQQETREIEIEYQQSILDNANLVKEANAIILSWKSMDEMAEWMYQHTTDIDKKSDEMVAKLIDDWHTMYDNIQVYNQMTATDLKGMFNITAKEVNNVITNTSDTLVNEAKRALEEIKKSVDDSIENAQESVKNAMKALTDAQEKYNDALEEQAKLNKELAKQTTEKAQAEYEEREELKLVSWERFEKAMGLVSEYNRYSNNSNAQSAIIQEAKSQGVYDLFNLAIPNSPSYGLISQNNQTVSMQDNDILAAVRKTTVADFEQLIAFSVDTAMKYLNQYKDYMKPMQYKTFYEKLEEAINNDSSGIYSGFSLLPKPQAYASGGLVDYTGLAMVHGTKDRPESFLSAEDTIRLGEAVNVLRDLVMLNHDYSASTLTPSIRDSNVEIHIHVDSIATEDQVDYLIDRVKDEIVDAANPIGSSVIIH